MAKSKSSSSKKQNQLRIIGGTWRGRKLNFPDLPGLRPTSDRIRETLFNWLQGEIAGANVLDLFAGSGALGLEALSRGANEVVFVDSQKQAIEQIKKNADVLNVNNAKFILNEALSYLQSTSENQTFDLVFLDPPFHKDMLQNCLMGLYKGDFLNASGVVYVETEKELDPGELLESWEMLKSKKAGKVYYYLLKLNENLFKKTS